MKKLRILVITGTMDVGGIENQLMYLLRHADKDRFQIDFTTTMEHPFYQNEIEALGGRCIHIRSAEGRHFIRYCRELYHIMKENYDVVHSHELFHSGMVLLTARLAGVKSRFVHAHSWSDGDGSDRKASLIRQCYNAVMRHLIIHNATDFCACSTFAGRFLYGERVIRQPNYHLIFNSVDATKFLDAYDKKENGEFCDDGWVNVLQIGRFSAVKNQLFTAEIADELKKREKKIRILCAGNNGNEYEQSVRNAIENKCIHEYMLLLGIRKDIDVLARKASAFLLPSLYEGMPLVLIEAQAAGLPCVVADTFSHEIDFGIDTICWLPLSQDAAQWANALEKAVSTPRAKKTDVVTAINKYGFDSKVFAKKLYELYESSVAKNA